MLKFTKTICVAVLLSTIAWTNVVNANDSAGIGAPLGSYSGGGYRITLDGRTGNYVGFDRRGRKLVIGNPSYPSDRTAQWTNKGYTYRIVGIGEPVDNAEDFRKVRLTVSNPQGRIILNQIMSRR